jgi:hypothetical protein
VRMPLLESPQGEAISFTVDGTGLVVSSEGLPADVTVVPLSDVPSPAAASGPADDSLPDLRTTDDGGVPAIAAGVAAGVMAAVVAAALVWIVGRLRRRP